MKSDYKNDQAVEIWLVENGDVSFELDDFPPVLKCDWVDVIFLDIREVMFTYWKRKTLVFDFRVFEPDQYEGMKLQMFTRIGNWKNIRPLVSSKLAKLAKIAGCQRRFTKCAFVDKAFRCRLTKTREDAPYSVIDMVVEKLTG